MKKIIFAILLLSSFASAQTGPNLKARRLSADSIVALTDGDSVKFKSRAWFKWQVRFDSLVSFGVRIDSTYLTTSLPYLDKANTFTGTPQTMSSVNVDTIGGKTGVGVVRLPAITYFGYVDSTSASDLVLFNGNGFRADIDGSTFGSDISLAIPDASGTFALLDGGQTFTSAIWHGTSIDTAYTNAVSKLNSLNGITFTKYAKDYSAKIDSLVIAGNTVLNTTGYHSGLGASYFGNSTFGSGTFNGNVYPDATASSRNLGTLGQGWTRMVIEHASSRAEGLMLRQTAASTGTPRIMFDNPTSWAGQGVALYHNAAWTMSFTTGVTAGSSTGTERWRYDTTGIRPATNAVYNSGSTGLNWLGVYSNNYYTGSTLRINSTGDATFAGIIGTTGTFSGAVSSTTSSTGGTQLFTLTGTSATSTTVAPRIGWSLNNGSTQKDIAYINALKTTNTDVAQMRFYVADTSGGTWASPSQVLTLTAKEITAGSTRANGTIPFYASSFWTGTTQRISSTGNSTFVKTTSDSVTVAGKFNLTGITTDSTTCANGGIWLKVSDGTLHVKF